MNNGTNELEIKNSALLKTELNFQINSDIIDFTTINNNQLNSGRYVVFR